LQGDDVTFPAKMLDGRFIIYQYNDTIALSCRCLPPYEYQITIINAGPVHRRTSGSKKEVNMTRHRKLP